MYQVIFSCASLQLDRTVLILTLIALVILSFSWLSNSLPGKSIKVGWGLGSAKMLDTQLRHMLTIIVHISDTYSVKLREYFPVRGPQSSAWALASRAGAGPKFRLGTPCHRPGIVDRAPKPQWRPQSPSWEWLGPARGVVDPTNHPSRHLLAYQRNLGYMSARAQV